MADWQFSPRQIERAMGEAQRLRATELAEEQDAQLIHDTLEGETAVFETMDAIGQAILADKLLVKQAKERIKRVEQRIDYREGTLARMLDALNIGKSLERPLFTLVLSWITKPIITDEKALAPKYIRSAADTAAIGKALRDGTFEGEGAVLSNPQRSIRLNSK